MNRCSICGTRPADPDHTLTKTFTFSGRSETRIGFDRVSIVDFGSRTQTVALPRCGGCAGMHEQYMKMKEASSPWEILAMVSGLVLFFWIMVPLNMRPTSYPFLALDVLTVGCVVLIGGLFTGLVGYIAGLMRRRHFLAVARAHRGGHADLITSRTSGENEIQSEEDAFFRDLDTNLATQGIRFWVPQVRAFYERCKHLADEIAWGRGANAGTFNPVFRRVSAAPCFSVSNDGTLTLNYPWIPGPEVELLKSSMDKIHVRMIPKNIETLLDIPDSRRLFEVMPVPQWAMGDVPEAIMRAFQSSFRLPDLPAV